MSEDSIDKAVKRLRYAIDQIPFGFQDDVFERVGIAFTDVSDEDVSGVTLDEMRAMRTRALVNGLKKGSVTAIRAFTEYEQSQEAVRETSDLVINIVPYEVPDVVPDSWGEK